jgi:hypothetical protein
MADSIPKGPFSIMQGTPNFETDFQTMFKTTQVKIIQKSKKGGSHQIVANDVLIYILNRWDTSLLAWNFRFDTPKHGMKIGKVPVKDIFRLSNKAAFLILNGDIDEEIVKLINPDYSEFITVSHAFEYVKDIKTLENLNYRTLSKLKVDLMLWD